MTRENSATTLRKAPTILDHELWPVFVEVVAEFKRADIKHGPRTLNKDTCTDIERIVVLGEEFGEVCRAMTYDEGDVVNLKEELIQVAHVAMAWASRL